MELDIPDSLLRFFDQEEHAHQFIAGRLRFGLLDYYKTIEGSRRDEKEGRTSIYWNKKAPQLEIGLTTGRILDQTESNQNIHCSGTSLNPFYIISASCPNPDIPAFVTKFGPFIVRINDPLALLRRIKTVWRNHQWSLAESTSISKVVYNKGGILEPDPYLIAPYHYTYSQKPDSDTFKLESEFR